MGFVRLLLEAWGEVIYSNIAVSLDFPASTKTPLTTYKSLRVSGPCESRLAPWWMLMAQSHAGNYSFCEFRSGTTCRIQKTAFYNVLAHSQFSHSFCPLFCDVLDLGDIDVLLIAECYMITYSQLLTSYVWVSAVLWSKLSAPFIYGDKHICLDSNLMSTSCPLRKNNSCTFSARIAPGMGPFLCSRLDTSLKVVDWLSL